MIEDEPAILRFLRPALASAGWTVAEAATGEGGMALAASRKPDVILLDLGLPDQDGVDVLKTLRQWSSSPVIVISARGQEKDKIAALDQGADDYLTKPFGVGELLARIRAALRRPKTGGREDPVYEHGGLKIDLALRRVWFQKKEIRLSPQQYDLLAVLVRHGGRVVSHQTLLKEAWGEDRVVTAESVRIFVHQLRHKIELDPVRPRLLKTEPGVGYRLLTPDD